MRGPASRWSGELREMRQMRELRYTGRGGRHREVEAVIVRQRPALGGRGRRDLVRERELVRARDCWGKSEGRARDPCGSEARGRGWILAESGPAQVRSSNRASLPGRAEGRFSVELGTARLSRAGLTNSEIAKNLGRDGNIWVRPGYQTDPYIYHTLIWMR
jgi:hypothetical protein